MNSSRLFEEKSSGFALTLPAYLTFLRFSRGPRHLRPRTSLLIVWTWLILLAWCGITVNGSTHHDPSPPLPWPPLPCSGASSPILSPLERASWPQRLRKQSFFNPSKTAFCFQLYPAAIVISSSSTGHLHPSLLHTYCFYHFSTLCHRDLSRDG